MEATLKEVKELAEQRLPTQKYDFEIEKTAKIILEKKYNAIALQFPDGLMCYSTALSDIFSGFFFLLKILLKIHQLLPIEYLEFK